jgi:hypothetical protein
MTALKRRCRLLLRAYPAWYRAERGDEMAGATAGSPVTIQRRSANPAILRIRGRYTGA